MVSPYDIINPCQNFQQWMIDHTLVSTVWVKSLPAKYFLHSASESNNDRPKCCRRWRLIIMALFVEMSVSCIIAPVIWHPFFPLLLLFLLWDTCHRQLKQMTLHVPKKASQWAFSSFFLTASTVFTSIYDSNQSWLFE